MKLNRLTFSVGTVLFLACGLAVGAGNNVFVSDSSNGTIVQLDANGDGSIFASGLNNPTGLAFDGSGNLYVANSGSGTILKLNRSGVASVFASGLNNPAGLVFGDNGTLYVANAGDGTILQFNPNGQGSIFASSLVQPKYLTLDPAGNVYVSSTHAVQEFDLGGNETWSMTPSESVYGIALNSEGNLCVAFHNAGVIDVLGDGVLNYPSDVDCFQTMPLGLAFDRSGNLYATFQQLAYFGTGTGIDTVLPGAVMEFAGGNATVLATGLADPEYIAVQQAQSTPVQFVPEPSAWTIMVVGMGTLLGGCRSRVIHSMLFQRLRRRS